VNKVLSFAAQFQSATVAVGSTQFPVSMRIAPSALEQSGTATQYMVQSAAGSTTCSAVPAFNANLTSTEFGGSTFTVASGLTTGQIGSLRTDSTNGATAYLGWSVEL
jgi:hypothetical protein